MNLTCKSYLYLNLKLDTSSTSNNNSFLRVSDLAYFTTSDQMLQFEAKFSIITLIVCHSIPRGTSYAYFFSLAMEYYFILNSAVNGSLIMHNFFTDNISYQIFILILVVSLSKHFFM